MSADDVTYEELRSVVLDYLKSKMDTQVLEVLQGVETLCVGRGMYANQTPWVYGGTVTEHKMPKEDREKVREIINDLINEGVLGWGINENNPAPPFLKVTRHGKLVVQTGLPQPYDPDGYLKYLKSEIPQLDDVIFLYMSESLHAYLKGLVLSSTVMLGCASEKAFLLMKSALIASIADPTKKLSIEKKLDAFSIKKQFDEFRVVLSQIKKQLPKPLIDDLDVQLDGVFNLIRNCRNDVGHPTGRIIDRSLAYNNLRLFIPYCKRIYELIDFFSKNSMTL